MKCPTQLGVSKVAVLFLSIAGIGIAIMPESLKAQQNPKIAAIDMAKALASTQEGQKASQDLSSKVNPKQQEFNTRRDEITQLESQLTRGTALSEEKKNDLAREIDTKKKRLDRDTQDADESLRNEQQELLQKFGQRLMTVITKYGKDNGYTLVLEAGDPNAQVIFAAPETDITSSVVALYDKTYPLQSAAASAVKP